ncbi:hypothetical protein OEZ86_004724 [Tetradesmus obliquus]|nr:hypothetical protein OEZ86_004724 [Tetradesmus obliquus]
MSRLRERCMCRVFPYSELLSSSVPRHQLQVLVIACCCKAFAAQVEGTGNDIRIHDGSPQGRSAGAAASRAAAAIQTNYIAAPHTADAPFASNVPAHITIYERCNYQGRAARGYVGPFPSLPAEWGNPISSKHP